MSVNLRIPGPTPCPDDVLQAMSRQMINHRGPEFAEIIAAHHVRPEDDVRDQERRPDADLGRHGRHRGCGGRTRCRPATARSCVSIGVFGDRFADIGKTYGVDVEKISFAQGTAADPEKVDGSAEEGRLVQGRHGHAQRDLDRRHERPRRDREGDPSACGPTSSSSSTRSAAWAPCRSRSMPGTWTSCSPDRRRAGWCRRAWRWSRSSKRGWDAVAKARIPRYYFDYSKAKSYLEKGQTPWTPAVSVYFAMDVALQEARRTKGSRTSTPATRASASSRATA